MSHTLRETLCWPSWPRREPQTPGKTNRRGARPYPRGTPQAQLMTQRPIYIVIRTMEPMSLTYPKTHHLLHLPMKRKKVPQKGVIRDVTFVTPNISLIIKHLQRLTRQLGGMGVYFCSKRGEKVDYRTHPPSFLEAKRGGGYIFWRKK